MNRRTEYLPLLKTPIGGRIFLAVVAIACFWPLAARGETLREADVIRLARARDPDAAVVREAVSVAAAQEVEAGLYPNPVLAWNREYLPGGGGPGLADSEDALFLTVPIDFSGRRPARKSLARAGTAIARSDAARAQSRAIARALLVFYEAVAAQRRAEIARRRVDRLTEAARVLGRRHAEGTAPGYERTRLELEAELAESELREAESRAATLRRELALLLGLEPGSVEIAGKVAPAVTPESLPRAPAPTWSRPSIDILRGSLVDVRSARDSAGWAWLPTLSLSGGLRVGMTDETRYGYVAGVAVSIPIFSHGQELRAEADARHRFIAARVRSAEQSARIETMRAVDEFTLASSELARFDEATADRTTRLIRAAESGYREGRLSIIELLDAERARAAVESRRLDLALAARGSEIALRGARGDFE